MQLPFFTLSSLTITTLCASICPMNMEMDMMSMEHGNMQVMAQAMDHGKDREMPCNRCDQNEKDVVSLTSPTNESLATAQASNALVAVTSLYTDSLHSQKIGLPHAHTRPPPLSISLVGTVILRT